MTPSEINEAVAVGLGWTLTGECGGLKAYRNFQDDHFSEQEYIPAYCIDIAAAWEVVEKANLTLTKTKEGHWYAFPDMGMSETVADEWYFNASEEHWPGGALADTAPMAICLAYLKLL